MKNRISKKKHKEFLSSALYYASMANEIRPKLITKEIKSVELNEKSISKSESIWPILNKWKLSYVVEVADNGEITNFPYYTGCILFKCYAQKYPWIKEYSGNNPEVLTT